MGRRLAIGIPASLLLAFAAVTLVALESGEVIVLRTRDPEGAVRETRVWVAEADGALWVEAASGERAWYRDLRRHPRIEVVRRGEGRCVVATPVAGAEGHARIRRLLRQRYGWADAWVGRVQDTSGSIAVRLDPCPPGSGGLRRHHPRPGAAGGEAGAARQGADAGGRSGR